MLVWCVDSGMIEVCAMKTYMSLEIKNGYPRQTNEAYYRFTQRFGREITTQLRVEPACVRQAFDVLQKTGDFADEDVQFIQQAFENLKKYRRAE